MRFSCFQFKPHPSLDIYSLQFYPTLPHAASPLAMSYFRVSDSSSNKQLVYTLPVNFNDNLFAG